MLSFSLEKLGSVLTLYWDIAGRRVAYIQPSMAKVQPTRAKTGLSSDCTAAIVVCFLTGKLVDCEDDEVDELEYRMI